MPPKVFICFDESYSMFISSKSANDLKTLFGEWFGYNDVVFSDFTANFSGLQKSDNAVFVTPGGSAVLFHEEISPLIKKIYSQNRAPIHSLFVCAGAYLAGDHYDAYNMAFMEPFPKFFGTNEDNFMGPLLGIIPSCKTFGPIYPNASYLERYQSNNLTMETLRSSGLRRLGVYYFLAPLCLYVSIVQKFHKVDK